jgi:hypothetical protein
MERRESPRVDLVSALHGKVTALQPTTIRQVSLQGMEVETSFPFQLDSLHDFRFTLSDRSLVVKGRVVHSSITDVDQDTVLYRSGIEFIEPSGRALDVIARFLEAVKHA